MATIPMKWIVFIYLQRFNTDISAIYVTFCNSAQADAYYGAYGYGYYPYAYYAHGVGYGLYAHHYGRRAAEV